MCGDGDSVPIPTGSITLYLDDSELNRDSAILVKAGGRSFLNLNDCRIVDALPGIARTEGSPDVFACQFSGAGWHPTCYEYPREQYEDDRPQEGPRQVQRRGAGDQDAQAGRVPAVGGPAVLPGPGADPPQLRARQHLPAGPAGDRVPREAAAALRHEVARPDARGRARRRQRRDRLPRPRSASTATGRATSAITRPRSSRSSRRAPTSTARATTASGCSRASGRCSRRSSRA